MPELGRLARAAAIAIIVAVAIAAYFALAGMPEPWPPPAWK